MKQEDYLQILYYSNKLLYKSVINRITSNYLILFLLFLCPIIAFTYLAVSSAMPSRELYIAVEIWLFAIIILFLIYLVNAKKKAMLYRDERETGLRIKARKLRSKIQDCKKPLQVYKLCKKIHRCELELNLIKEVETVLAHCTESTWPDGIELIETTDSPLIQEDAQKQQKLAKRRMVIRRLITTTIWLLPVFLTHLLITNWIKVGTAPIIVAAALIYISELWRVKGAAPLLEGYWREKCHKEAAEQTYAWMNLPAFSLDKTSPSWIFDARDYHSQAFEAGEKMKAIVQCIKFYGPWHTGYAF